jgi:hypothetical protein
VRGKAGTKCGEPEALVVFTVFGEAAFQGEEEQY